MNERLGDREILARFSTLEGSNLSLAAEVQGLTKVLNVISDLQVEQRRIRETAEQAEREVKRVEREATARDHRARQVTSRWTLAAAVILPLVSIIIYVALLDHVNRLLNETDESRIRVCETVNSGTSANIQREQILASAETHSALRQAHERSVAALRRSIVNCAAIRQDQ